MFELTHLLRVWITAQLQNMFEARRGDRGAGTVETVIIYAAAAALALSLMGAIKLLVDRKVGGISL